MFMPLKCAAPFVANFAQFSSTSQIFLQQIDARLQGLLSGYARLLSAAAQQQQYLKSTEQDGIKREIASLQKALSSDPAESAGDQQEAH